MSGRKPVSAQEGHSAAGAVNLGRRVEPGDREKLVTKRGDFRKLGRSGGVVIVPGFRDSKYVRVVVVDGVLNVR